LRERERYSQSAKELDRESERERFLKFNLLFLNTNNVPLIIFSKIKIFLNFLIFYHLERKRERKTERERDREREIFLTIYHLPIPIPITIYHSPLLHTKKIFIQKKFSP